LALDFIPWRGGKCRTVNKRRNELPEMANLFSLAGKTALVTGSSRGLGWAIAQGMARAGAHVVLNGRDEAALANRLKDLKAEGLSGSVTAFDVTDEGQSVRAVRSGAEGHGLDVIVCNAGVQHRRALVDFETADYERVIATNQTACFVLAREAARHMIGQGRGRIIFIASVMSQVARPTVSAYIVSKGALRAMTAALAVELGPQGITCNAIAPGYFVTDLNKALVDDAAFSAFVESRTPLGRWGQPEEIAGAAVFLAAPAGSYVNGHILTVDGGLVVNA
jgi:gluconate 5-dehydrogenase